MVKLHDLFLDKMLQKVKSGVMNVLSKEDYVPIEVTTEDEFEHNVERFEFELFDHFRFNKITTKIHREANYRLPYSKSVVAVNYLLADFIAQNIHIGNSRA